MRSAGRRVLELMLEIFLGVCLFIVASVVFIFCGGRVQSHGANAGSPPVYGQGAQPVYAELMSEIIFLGVFLSTVAFLLRCLWDDDDNSAAPAPTRCTPVGLRYDRCQDSSPSRPSSNGSSKSSASNYSASPFLSGHFPNGSSCKSSAHPRSQNLSTAVCPTIPDTPCVSKSPTPKGHMLHHPALTPAMDVQLCADLDLVPCADLDSVPSKFQLWIELREERSKRRRNNGILGMLASTSEPNLFNLYGGGVEGDGGPVSGNRSDCDVGRCLSDSASSSYVSSSAETSYLSQCSTAVPPNSCTRSTCTHSTPVPTTVTPLCTKHDASATDDARSERSAPSVTIITRANPPAWLRESRTGFASGPDALSRLADARCVSGAIHANCATRSFRVSVPGSQLGGSCTSTASEMHGALSHRSTILTVNGQVAHEQGSGASGLVTLETLILLAIGLLPFLFFSGIALYLIWNESLSVDK